MSWREVSPEPVVKTQRQIVQDLCRPLTLADAWDLYQDERLDDGDEIEKQPFNLNTAEKRIE